jgi:hypothetical protein
MVALDARVSALVVGVHDCAAPDRPSCYRDLRAEIEAADAVVNALVDLLGKVSGRAVSRVELVGEARWETSKHALAKLTTWQAAHAPTANGSKSFTADLLGRSVPKLEAAAVAPAIAPAPADHAALLAGFAQPLAEAEREQKRSAARWLAGGIGSVIGMIGLSLGAAPLLAHATWTTTVPVHGTIWLGLGSISALCLRLWAQCRLDEDEYRRARLSTVANPRIKHYLESLSPAKQEEVILKHFEEWFEERRAFRRTVRKDSKVVAALTRSLRQVTGDMTQVKDRSAD